VNARLELRKHENLNYLLKIQDGERHMFNPGRKCKVVMRNSRRIIGAIYSVPGKAAEQATHALQG